MFGTIMIRWGKAFVRYWLQGVKKGTAMEANSLTSSMHQFGTRFSLSLSLSLSSVTRDTTNLEHMVFLFFTNAWFFSFFHS